MSEPAGDGGEAGGSSSTSNSMDDPAASPGSSNAVTRLRRSISAARAAKAAQADDQAAAVSLQDDDSSLVLYGDPSRLSTRSRGSVMSGAHEQGETFFTALKRQPSWQSDTGSEAYMQAVGSKAGSLCCADSQVNPVQSVSNSAFFSAVGADDAGDADGDGDDGSLMAAGQEDLAGFGASKESSYASMLQDGNTPASLPDASDGQLTSSVLNIIDCLYGGAAAAASSSHAWQQQQQQLSLQDQALREMPVAAASQQPPAAGSEQAAAEAAPSDRPDATAEQLEQVSSEVHRPDSAGRLSTNADTSYAVVQAPDPEQQQQQEGADTTADEHEPADAAGDGSIASSDADSSADGKALLASMDGLLAERSRLQQELSGYLQQLGSQEDGEGEPLVVLAGQDYALLVERLLREGRAQQYRALQGWEGPHRFEDLPVAQLATSHKDPEVAAGLAAIAKLDAQLQEANLKALLSARALNPDQWADAEKRRLERRAAELDAALSKERQRRAHAAKLRCALGRLDTEASRASLLGVGSSSFSYYRLKPQEEELLASVLARDDATLEADNPFDPMLLCLEEEQDCFLEPASASTCRTSDTDQQTSRDGGGQSEQPLTAVSGAAAGVQEGPAGTPGVPTASAQELLAGSTGSASALSSRLSSCLSGSVFSLMRASSGTRGRRCSLAEIDAQLEAMQAEREVAAQLQAGRAGSSLLSRTTSSSKSSGKAPARTLLSQASTATTASGIPLSPAATVSGSSSPSRTQSFTGASRIPSAPTAAAATTTPGAAISKQVSSNSGNSSRQPRVSACSGVGSVGAAHQGSLSGSNSGGVGASRRGSSSAASSDGSGRSGGGSSTVRTIDYLREQREVKELAQREVELDAQLRALQTSELQPSRLTAQQLQTLLQAAY